MTAADIVNELKSLGNESYKRIMLNHGVKEPVLGVKIEDMKKIQKRVKKDYRLALDLYDTGIYDAMYLAGLVADDKKMTKKDLQKWAERANCFTVCQYTVPWVAAESDHGWELGLKWIDSKKPELALCGWGTLASLVAIKDDAELDLDMLAELLQRVVKTIHKSHDRVAYAMNGFVIAVGAAVAPLTDLALKAAKEIGKVEVDMGDTSCKVPDAAEYINKVKERGAIGKKRKSAKC